MSYVVGSQWASLWTYTKKGETAMSAVEPVRMDPDLLKKHPEMWIELTQPGGLGLRMKDKGVTKRGFQLLHDCPEATALLVEVLGRDSDAATTALSSLLAELGSRPKFGDHLLAERGIMVNQQLGPRGQTIPEETALSDLRTKTFLKSKELSITGKQVQDRALDEAGEFSAPWGRDLLWRILNNQEGEGDAILATLDQSKYYVFAGDKDLQGSGGDAVLLYLYCYEGLWNWGYYYVDRDNWFARDQLLTLGNSSD